MSDRAPSSGGGALPGGLNGIFRSRIMAALATALSFLLLNLALILACALVVTVPVAVNAAFVAIERWRGEREERVSREFLIAIRSSAPLRTTIVVGVPLVAVGLGVEEVRYFASSGGSVGRICFGLGISALLLSVTGLGYVLLLAVRAPQASASDVWTVATRAAIRNVFVTGPLFVIEIGAAALVALFDPPLCVLGLPVLLLLVMHRTADLGLRRLARDRTS